MRAWWILIACSLSPSKESTSSPEPGTTFVVQYSPLTAPCSVMYARFDIFGRLSMSSVLVAKVTVSSICVCRRARSVGFILLWGDVVPRASLMSYGREVQAQSRSQKTAHVTTTHPVIDPAALGDELDENGTYSDLICVCDGARVCRHSRHDQDTTRFD